MLQSVAQFGRIGLQRLAHVQRSVVGLDRLADELLQSLQGFRSLRDARRLLQVMLLELTNLHAQRERRAGERGWAHGWGKPTGERVARPCVGAADVAAVGR